MWCLLSGSESPDSFAFHSYTDVYCQHQSRRKEWFVLLNLFFFLSGQLQFYFIFPFNRSQHGSSLETHHLRQEMQWWPSLQSKDVTQISRKHKAWGLICAWRESELICAWWVAVVNCVLQKASSALAIHLQGKSSLPSTVSCQSAKGHGGSIVPQLKIFWEWAVIIWTSKERNKGNILIIMQAKGELWFSKQVWGICPYFLKITI